LPEGFAILCIFCLSPKFFISDAVEAKRADIPWCFVAVVSGELNMQAGIEQNRLGAQLLVMDALLESARAGETLALSAQDIAMSQILRMLSDSDVMTASGLFDAALLYQTEVPARV
jgi:hypothetical protein